MTREGHMDIFASMILGLLPTRDFNSMISLSVRTRLNWRWDDKRETSMVCRSRIPNCSFKSQSSPCHGLLQGLVWLLVVTLTR